MCMVMFVNMDMNEEKIAPNSFNFAGDASENGPGTHGSTSTITADLLKEKISNKKDQ